MPHDVSANYDKATNQESNQPLWLYRVQITDDPADDVFLAESREDIQYFKTDAGVDTPQLYRAFPITHGGIGRNIEGQLSSLQIAVTNIGSEFQSYVENNSGLRGNKVTIRQVFGEHLDDPNAYQSAVYYIDSVSVSGDTINFSLKPRIAIMHKRVPRRTYQRNYCPWTYKGLGCWISNPDGTFTMPTGFEFNGYRIWEPEIVGTGDNVTPAEGLRRFAPINLKNIDLANDVFICEMKCSDPSKLTANSAIEIGSGGQPDVSEIQFTDLSTLGLTTEWQPVTIDFSKWTVQGTAPDYSKINYLRIYAGFTSGPESIHIRYTKAILTKPFGYYIADLDTCAKTLDECRRHNNTARFGGYPNVPGGRGRIVV